MLGFVRTDDEALVSYLGDPQRSVAAYRALMRRGEEALGAIRGGLSHGNPGVREGCCRLPHHLVDPESMGQLVAMADDPDAGVRIAAFHALACDRCKGDTCAPGAGRVLEPALRHLAADPDAQVRSRAAELVGKFVHTDARAVAALEAARVRDPSAAVRKKAGWHAPGGTHPPTDRPRARPADGAAGSLRPATPPLPRRTADGRLPLEHLAASGEPGPGEDRGAEAWEPAEAALRLRGGNGTAGGPAVSAARAPSTPGSA
ncbi:HEAT repeat domain-containing protein [Streptomyces sp. TLI_171]|uniref:HEAT repeat domain-containing protein n=1 Tax=Streptomyces sp. TLI_171 TaxID=1938859 RepID=UPI000C174A87|nr:HEAT repeat domain-containing protein [Streptomyces sp. TLI_171]RKE23190.1 HEAT repeat protein [Streptomyces sp. TLI_171]